MSKIKREKKALKYGLGTAMVAALVSGQASAQSITIDTTVAVSGVDSAAGSEQANDDNVTASASGAETTVTAQTVSGSSLAIDTNRSGASAVGNTDTLSLADTDGAANSTTAAITARQANTGTEATNIAISATTTGTDVALQVGNTTGDNLALRNSTDAATATGNTVAQSLTLAATSLTLGTTSASANTEGTQEINASGQALAASLQLNTYADTSATNTGSTMTVDAADATGSALELEANTQDATATGSTAGNTLAISGTTVGGGAAIVAQQENDAASSVTAQTTASALLNADSMTGGAAGVSANRIQSRATGGSTTNTLTADATSITLAAPVAAEPATTATASSADTLAAYATLNDQFVAGSVSATSSSEAGVSAFTLDVTDDVSGSSLANDSNTVSARAQGAVTANATTLTVGGTLSQAAGDPIANVAAVTNVQELADDANVTATVDSNTANTLTGSVGGALTASSLSTSANRLQANAEGTSASNSLAVSATTLSLAAGGGALSGSSRLAAGTATADAAFSVTNMQSGGASTISAQLVDTATVATGVTGAVNGSAISSNGNGLDAFASGNKATSNIALSGTTVATDAGIISAQSSNGAVLSTIGYAADGTTASLAGVTVNLADLVDDSNVTVNGNVVRGSSIANSAGNTLAVSATTLSGDGSDDQGTATGDAGGNVNATGDFSLASSQSLGADSSSTTAVAATFGIDQAADMALTDSRLSVSNNTQFGEVLGNSATNRIALSATDAGAGINPTASLANAQDGATADISADSRMNVFANVAADGSSIAMSGNANTALGVVNNASNAIAVSAVSLDGAADVAEVDLATDTATADYALLNRQSAEGAVSSNARTDLFNTDFDRLATSGTQDSRVAMNANSTMAEASANRVANSIQLSALDNGATAALGNVQSSNTTVTATSATVAQFAIDTDNTPTALSGSAINMDGNATTALARGNTANNAMTYSVGATYSGATGATITGGASVAATATVLNDQVNSGAVSASSTSASYAIALNAGTGTAVSGSSVSAGNNAVNALAFGNSAVNSLTMATFGAGLPSSAVNSVQSNSGAVSC